MPSLGSDDQYKLLIETNSDTKGIDKTKDSLKGLDSSTQKSHGSFLKLSAAVAAGEAIYNGARIAIGKTVDFLGSSVKEYQQAETAQKELYNAVINVTKGTQKQLAATNALADSLSKKGVLDDDVIRKGQAQLSTFGLTNKSVQKLSAAMADLTVNQSGVNATGEQAVQSANIMAKALNGNFGALEKMGIHLTDTQKKLIKFGDESQRVDTINKVLAANLRTNQATALQTTEGRLAHLKVAYGNVKEEIGKLVVGALTPLAEKAQKFIDSVDWKAVLDKTVNALKDFWNILKNIYTTVSDVGKQVVAYLAPSFVALWNTVTQKLFPALWQLYNNVLKPMLPVIGALFVGAIKLSIDAINAIIAVLSPLIMWLGKHEGIVKAVVVALGAYYAAMKLIAAYTAFMGFIGRAGDAITLFRAKTVLANTQMGIFSRLMGTPFVLGVTVAAALVALYAVVKAAQAVKQAVTDVNNAAKAADNFNQQANTVKIIEGLKYQIKYGKTQAGKKLSAAQIANAKKSLNNLYAGKGFASGGFTGIGGSNDIAGVVHKGEYVVPKSGVDQASGKPKAMGNTVIIQNVNLSRDYTFTDMLKEIDNDARTVLRGGSPARGQV